ncbi:MAG: hypothetical protein ACD_62C00354G0001 [uncultured bacterium]|nr:MAG: hypothetical protein ACD_62C00354G0001 [uncultured bacterium]
MSQLIQSETKQISDLYGFNFRVSERGQEKVVTANDIQTVLETAKDLKQRQLYWEASKEVGVVLKEGLDKLRGLRNEVARHMGYSSFFALGVDEYDFTSDEMIAMMDKLLEEIKPLYRELHTYARYELAKRYNLPVPDYLPAHWLGNRWGQNWPGLVEGIDYNQGFKDKTSEWMIKTAEKYYMSQGFPALSENFWKNSDLYELPADAKRKKNTHASAWHLNLDDDYRSLMSIKPDYDWFTTIHHELGHIYYYITYAVPSVPPLLRDSPTSGFHEAITTFNQLAVSQRSYLTSYGITEAKADSPDDDIRALLAQAFEFVVFLPFGAGTMPHFEYALYENNLDPSQFNKAWWDYVKKYQGVVPPTERDEHYCDAASKTHINDYPVMYFNYAFAQVLAYQLNDHIAKNILKKDPHNVNYFGQKEAGDFLRKMMVQGNTKGWRELLKETVGSELSAKPMLEYYAPLMTYLKEQNKGRVYSEF